jgi:hypothetical protein
MGRKVCLGETNRDAEGLTVVLTLRRRGEALIMKLLIAREFA